jgi:hypothetical protein
MARKRADTIRDVGHPTVSATKSHVHPRNGTQLMHTDMGMIMIHRKASTPHTTRPHGPTKQRPGPLSNNDSALVHLAALRAHAIPRQPCSPHMIRNTEHTRVGKGDSGFRARMTRDITSGRIGHRTWVGCERPGNFWRRVRHRKKPN